MDVFNNTSVAPVTPTTSEVPPKKKSSSKLLMVALATALVVLLVIVGILVFALFKKNQYISPTKQLTETKQEEPVSGQVENLSYKCDDPVFLNDEKSVYYCSEAQGDIVIAKYDKCLASAKSYFKDPAFEPIRSRDIFKDSEKRTFYSINSQYNLVLNTHDIDETGYENGYCAELWSASDSPSINNNRLLKYSTSSTSLLLGSGIGGSVRVFDFSKGTNFEIKGLSDAGGDKLVYLDSLENGKLLEVNIINPVTGVYATVSVSIFDIESGKKIQEKNLALGNNDIPEYARKTIKPGFGADYFYSDKILEVTNVAFSNGEYSISYKVTNDPTGQFSEVERYPNFEQTGEFKFNF